MQGVIAGGVALFLALLLVWAVKRMSLARGWIARPRSDRWHTKAVALHGGIGIFLAFAGAIAAASLAAGWPVTLNWLLAGAAICFATGLVDDVAGLRPATKIVAQIIAASCIIAGAGWIIPLTDRFLLNTLLTFFWFIGIINATNLVDGLDGLAAGIVAIAAAFLASMVHMLGLEAPALTIALYALVGALLGFLVYNLNPASIFMGDSGSLTIGYLIAALSVVVTRQVMPLATPIYGLFRDVLPLLLPATLLAVPILDTTLVTVLRKWQGRSVVVGGMDHAHYRLTALGLSERRAVYVLYGLTVLGGSVALVTLLKPMWGLSLMGLYGMLMILLGVRLSRVEVAEPALVRHQTTKTRFALFVDEVLVRHRVAAMLVDVFLVGGAYYTAFLLRYESEFPGELAQLYGRTLPVVIPLSLAVFYVSGIYRSVWRTISIYDLRYYLIAFLVLPVALQLYYSTLERPYSDSLFVIFDLLVFALICASRVFFRLFDELVLQIVHREGRDKEAMLIYGAGDTARTAIHNVLTKRNGDVRIVGLVDDNPSLYGRNMWGFRVLGSREALPRIIDQYDVRRILVSTPKIEAAKLAEELERWGKDCAVFRLDVSWQPVERVEREQPGEKARIV